jgi:hypothetical protein
MKCSAPGCTHKATIVVKGPTPEGRTENWTVCASHEFELSQDPVNAIPKEVIQGMEMEYHTQRFMLYQQLHEQTEKLRKSGGPLTGAYRLEHDRLLPSGSTTH